MGNPITAVSEFTEPVTSPATNEPADEATFLAGLQALTNRTQFLKEASEAVGVAAQYVIGAGPFEDDDPLTLTALSESNGDYGLAFGALVVVPLPGIYKVTVSASLKSTATAKPSPVGIAVKVGGDLDVMARFKSYRYTANPDFPVQVDGTFLLSIAVPADSPIAFYAISGSGDLAPTADRSRVVVVRVSDLPAGATPSAPEAAADAEPSPDSSTTLSVWMADAAPLVPHADDEEFASAHALTLWDPGSYPVTLSVADNFLQAAMSGSGTFRQAGAVKAIPASEFVFYTRAHIIGQEGSVGIVVTGNVVGAPTTADFYLCKFDASNSGGTAGATVEGTFSDYLTNSAFSAKSNGFVGGYLRGRVNGTTIAFDYSPDGIAWHQFPARTVGFTPTHYGLAFSATLNAQAFIGKFKFLRVESGAGKSGFNATKIGRFV